MKITEITTEQAWQDHGKALKKFILSKVKNNDEADDILQDVFIKIHMNLPSLKDPGRLQPWIYQIARNAMQDHFRKRRFITDVEKIELPEEKENIDTVKFQSCMMPFVNKLPEKYRQALVLSDLKQIGQTNLAQRLKISYSAAKSRVQRARQLLSSYLNDCCEITSDKYGNIVSHIPRGKCSCSSQV